MARQKQPAAAPPDSTTLAHALHAALLNARLHHAAAAVLDDATHRAEKLDKALAAFVAQRANTSAGNARRAHDAAAVKQPAAHAEPDAEKAADQPAADADEFDGAVPTDESSDDEHESLDDRTRRRSGVVQKLEKKLDCVSPDRASAGASARNGQKKDAGDKPASAGTADDAAADNGAATEQSKEKKKKKKKKDKKKKGNKGEAASEGNAVVSAAAEEPEQRAAEGAKDVEMRDAKTEAPETKTSGEKDDVSKGEEGTAEEEKKDTAAGSEGKGSKKKNKKKKSKDKKKAQASEAEADAPADKAGKGDAEAPESAGKDDADPVKQADGPVKPSEPAQTAEPAVQVEPDRLKTPQSAGSERKRKRTDSAGKQGSQERFKRVKEDVLYTKGRNPQRKYFQVHNERIGTPSRGVKKDKMKARVSYSGGSVSYQVNSFKYDDSDSD